LRAVRRAIAGVVAAGALATSCGSDDGAGSGDPLFGGRPTEIESPRTPGTDAGRKLVEASGCLGCHQVGSTGNPGPGPDLTRVGARLRAQEIEDVLVDPRPPMPSYASLPAARRDEIVRYLASLR
jgi:mono/diheme cytochrome c family protein